MTPPPFPSTVPGPRVCGFSFGRNLTKLNYPVEAAVGSVLPLCRRFVFVVGRSDDDTRRRVENIDTSAMDGGRGGMIDIIDSAWPEVQVDGKVLAIEANKAMEAAERVAAEDGCTWGFYIQADEVIHENDLPLAAAGMKRWAGQAEVKALLFRYLHFVLDYETTDPWMYRKASRIVRLDRSCEIFGDACGPGLKDPSPQVLEINDGYLNKNHLGRQVRWAGDGQRHARVFHYGWVKTREELDAKLDMVDKLWWGTLPAEEKERRRNNKFGSFIDRYKALKKFRGPRETHPALMADRVASRPPFRRTANRYLQPRYYYECLKHGPRL